RRKSVPAGTLRHFHKFPGVQFYFLTEKSRFAATRCFQTCYGNLPKYRQSENAFLEAAGFPISGILRIFQDSRRPDHEIFKSQSDLRSPDSPRTGVSCSRKIPFHLLSEYLSTPAPDQLLS